MSAIFGFVRLREAPAELQLLAEMGEPLLPRAAGGQLTWVDGLAGLGQCVLHKPVSPADKGASLKRDGLVIASDARLDNRDDLITTLGIDRTRGRNLSDSDLILEAYIKWGGSSPTRLLGDFAFAVWDIAAETLFCARDHLGAKPFYYFFDAHTGFIFSSEIKAILRHSVVPRSLNEQKIADYLLQDFADRCATFYSHVSRLPPASALTVKEGRIEIRKYWSLDPAREIRLGSDGDYEEAFREIFTDAVRCRVRSEFPVGCMLSGGLDSSSIACVGHDLFKAERPGGLHTFSIVFDKIEKSDERTPISHVLASRQFQSHFVLGDTASPIDDLETVLRRQDEPFFAPNLFLNRLVWKAAQECGVRVLLDGLLGDNVVSHGIEYLNELAQRWRWMRLATELRQIIQKSKRQIPLRGPWLSYVRDKGIRPIVPEAALALLRRVRRQPAEPWENRLSVFNPDFVDQANLRQRLAIRYRQERGRKTARQAHADALESGMIETALEVYDHGCAEFGIEARFPFADKRLVEFCLGIPGSQKVSQGYTRMILRRALADHLPDPIRWRTDKGDLSWSFLDGFGRGVATVESKIESSKDFLRQFIDLARVDRLLSRLRRGVVTESEADLFEIAILAAWHSNAAEV